MPGVLAAELPALLAHQLEHVAVADAGAAEADAQARHRLLEREVGHQRAGDAFQRLARRALAGDDEQQLVAVVGPALRVDDGDAVAVAVEGDAEIGLLRRHFLLQRAGRGGADLVVDIEAIGLDTDRGDFGAELVEHVRRDVVGGAMRAIDDQLESLEVELVRES